MSVFGFPSTVTSLANFGASRSNAFEITSGDCTLDSICEGIDDILKCCNQVLTIVQNISGPISVNTQLINGLGKQIADQDKKYDAIFSAILDLRRELLRGNRDIRR